MIGFIAGMFLFFLLIGKLTGWSVGLNVLFSTIATALVELVSEELDNYVLPMYFSCLVVLLS